MEPNQLTLMAEEGTSLSSGSLRLYALPYGCIDLYAYDPLHHRCAVGIVIEKDFRRQGYALSMLQQLAAIYRGGTQLHQLYADIAATNHASLALFAKAGYTQCGHFAQWLNVNNHYIDTLRMQLIL